MQRERRNLHRNHNFAANTNRPPRRARSLWDDTRKPNATWSTYLRAILYELQPIRFSTLHSSTIGIIIRDLPTKCQKFVWTTFPYLMSLCWKFLCNRSMKEWVYFLGLVIYWRTVVYLHELLHAGPMVLIITALIGIFTIGLSDNENGEGYVSAYSVFNRGFQSILGSLDADQLVAQHVGGGVAAAAAVNAMDVRGGDDEFGGGNDRQRERQQVQGQAQALQEQQQQQQQQQAENNQNRNNKSRKSGKKARRKRNLEQRQAQRRDIELQREAAAAMGFGTNNEWNNNGEDNNS